MQLQSVAKRRRLTLNMLSDETAESCALGNSSFGASSGADATTSALSGTSTPRSAVNATSNDAMSLTCVGGTNASTSNVHLDDSFVSQ